ncbi:MAG TPA: branched-chain amino acid aminotransferase [Myxococcota bacterium]|nr:branched-chain amino acid aminotransferase [Myxococcota bacterium]HRY92707.1 branched-chain amino acid aminotransferase [Myxococcota bacterium]
MDIPQRVVEPAKRKPIPKDPASLGFGRYFSDHMFLMEYTPSKGWHDARIEPYHPLALDPSCMVLHYGQEAFEGLKAYRGKDDGVYLFRYRDNFKRMNASCERLCMPALPVDLVAEALKKLVLLESPWIPKSPGCALYIRPNIIATDAALGVRASESYLFYIITGPVGAYYPEGFNPISIYVSDHFVRAVRGGIGAAKTGGNYAASLVAQREAKSQGFSQVLWLDAIHRKYIEEVGTMNMFFRFGDEVVTCPLTGSILPGITRDSVLQVLKRWDTRVFERLCSIDEVVEGLRKGTVKEAFGSGTAAIISPVKSVRYKAEDFQVGDGKTGPLSKKLYDYLLALQYGHEPDPFGWVERIA